MNKQQKSLKKIKSLFEENKRLQEELNDVKKQLQNYKDNQQWREYWNMLEENMRRKNELGKRSKKN